MYSNSMSWGTQAKAILSSEIYFSYPGNLGAWKTNKYYTLFLVNTEFFFHLLLSVLSFSSDVYEIGKEVDKRL